ncbi:LysR family transcriptional regulator [Sulfitobacter sp. THAF37]|uniref:LysR family transcriptional regulator n=1 Tax=Sulfitobacter sp. THAF37 TaxID=2587855 RepID=UPI0012685723|nr:LysR family transcriptional regulator [Sulfitobacter sp. THAF37]
MNLRFLRTVVELAQSPSLNAAAKKLNLSHSAVSLQIKALEDELQFSILDRSKRPPILTGQGLALVEHARRMEDVVSDIQALADTKRFFGRVSVGAAPSTIQQLLAPTLAQLSVEHADLEIELISALSHDLINMVLDGSIHVALVTDPGTSYPNLATFPVCTEPFQLWVSDLEQSDDYHTILRTRPFIWFTRSTALSRRAEAYLHRNRINVLSKMDVNSFEGVEALVRHNLGISILPKRALAAPPRGIRAIDLEGEELNREIVLASRKNSPRKELVQRIHEVLLSLIEAPSQGVDGGGETGAPSV